MRSLNEHKELINEGVDRYTIKKMLADNNIDHIERNHRVYALQEDGELDVTDFSINKIKATLGLNEATKREKFFKKNDKLSDSDPKAYKDAPGDEEARKKGKVKTSKHTKKYKDIYEEEKESDKNNKKELSKGPLNKKLESAIKKKSKDTGVSMDILRVIARRGLAAWNTSHRPGAGQEQWALARINSFLTKSSGTWGKADADMAREVKKRGEDKKLKSS
jgi:hypothetical protein